jgi:alpha-glucosidase
MQWSAEKNAGFTGGEPWLPIAEDYTQVNVEIERDDPASMLTLYNHLIKVRRGESALEVGQFEPMEADGDLLTYVRRDRESAFLIALNLGLQPQVINFSSKASGGRIALSTHLDRAGEHVRGDLHLRAEEGLLVRLTDESRCESSA